MSTSLAVDWSDQETFARPPADSVSPGADPEASWGHRSAGVAKEDLFFGYFLSAATMVADEGAAGVPELIRRITLSSCALDPVVAFVPTLEVMAASGVALGDVLCDSGYAHRRAEHWALPVRRAGGRLVMDLHPHDRGSRGTFGGAICCNGNLYCPATPAALLDIEPLAAGGCRAGSRPRQAQCRAGPLQARAHQCRGRGGLSPRHVPGRGQQGALSAPGALHDPALRPTPDPCATRSRAPVLHQRHAQRAARGQRQDAPEARLPLQITPHLLRPTHRSGTLLRHPQGPRLDRCDPRLVPAHGADRHQSPARLCRRGAQRARAGRLRTASSATKRAERPPDSSRGRDAVDEGPPTTSSPRRADVLRVHAHRCEGAADRHRITTRDGSPRPANTQV